jgi:hypothetical protein
MLACADSASPCNVCQLGFIARIGKGQCGTCGDGVPETCGGHCMDCANALWPDSQDQPSIA